VKNAKKWRGLAGAALLALVLAACGGRGGDAGGGGQAAADPGITDTEIKLGGSYPFSGPASAYASIGKGVEAYWKYVNEEKGGVKMADGKTRKIAWSAYDDAYSPPRTVENVKRLIEQDRVFALFNTLGTPNNTSIVDYVNQSEVPHLFLATGATKWGDYKKWPWTIGFQPYYQAESAIYVEYLKKNKPQGSKVAILYANDDYGKDYLEGFEHAAQGTNVQIIARQSYENSDPTVDSQVVNLSGSGADVFFNIATPKFAAQAIKKIGETSWRPLHLLNNVSASITNVLKPGGLEASKGIVSTLWYKDPSDPSWANDPAMKTYKELLGKYCGGCDANDTFHVFAFIAAENMEKTLGETKAPTRKALMEAVRNIKDREIGLLYSGMKINTSPTDGYPIEAMQVVNFDGNLWKLQDQVIDVSSKRPAS
jgi:branched-chain amino acid transport system substrate-binding protein